MKFKDLIENQHYSDASKLLERKVFWNKDDIYKLSLLYQLEDEYAKEEKLIKNALKKYPDWDYLKERIEWHSRPLFDRDPKKSKLVPRKPLRLPRDPNYIPKRETLDSLCFVTGTSSNAPYFNLSIELLESLKATRWYKDIPIKVLDCGLTKFDKLYLAKRFGVEIKDPGWDIDPEIIDSKGILRILPKNGWKGIVARPHIHRHFPGYSYYLWLDADNWIQDERAIDRYVVLAEQYDIGIAQESADCRYWTKKHPFFKIITPEMRKILLNKVACIPNAYCISKKLNQEYEKHMKNTIHESHVYKWGYDLTTLNYCIHHHQFQPIKDKHINYNDRRAYGLPLANCDKLFTPDTKEAIGIMSLGGVVKYFPRIVPLCPTKHSIAHNRLLSICIFTLSILKKILHVNYNLLRLPFYHSQSIHYRNWPHKKKILNKLLEID